MATHTRVQSARPRAEGKPLIAYVVITIVIAAAGFVPIFIKYAQNAGAPSPYIVAVRLVLVSIALTPYILTRHFDAVRALRPTALALAAIAGLLMATNLLLLFYSLEYTSVLVNGALRRTSPLWVLAAEGVILHETFSRRVWASTFIALVGSLLITFGGSTMEVGSQPLLGASLALLNAFGIGAYLLIGRRINKSIPSTVYSWVVFSVAALVATTVAIVTGVPLMGYSATAYFWVLMVTVFAQFFAHLSINLGLRYFQATVMSIAMQASVVIGAILALFLLAEVPSALQVIGGAAVIASVLAVTTEKG